MDAVRWLIGRYPHKQHQGVLIDHCLRSMTLRETGKKHGISCEQVRQIRVKAEQYWRHPRGGRRLFDE